MRAFIFVPALLAALAAAAPNPVASEGELGIMPRACPGTGAHCGAGQHFVRVFPCTFSLYRVRTESANDLDVVQGVQPMPGVRHSLLENMTFGIGDWYWCGDWVEGVRGRSILPGVVWWWLDLI
jgi:hypothetical protein